MLIRTLFTVALAFVCLIPHTTAQITNTANKKFNVYKIDINPNAVKDGIRGISVLFSCEYNFSDPEYAGMRDSRGRTYFTFYAGITDKNSEPAYNPFNYSFYRKANETTALHFANEWAYEPQNKAQGRRNTGVELFIPFTHTTLPEGSNTVKFTLNALTDKGKRFENIYSQAVTINRPPVYAATLAPKQITVIDKNGKRYQVARLEQDLFVYPGTNKASPDVSAMANVDVNESLGFLYSEGDILSLKLQKSTQKGIIQSNKPRLLRTADGKALATFDNASALTGEWPFNPKAGKTLMLKNNALELQMDLAQYRVPAVQLSGFKVDPYATYKGVTGTNVTFNVQATLPAGLPPLEAWVAYQPDDAESQTYLVNGKVTTGKGKADTTGAVVLDRNTPGKVTVFYPAFNLLLNDPAARQNPPKQFSLQIRLQGNPGAIAQKDIRQNLPIGIIKEVTMSSAAVVKDTVVKNEHGVALSLGYQLPTPYLELLQGERFISLIGTPKDSRAVDLLLRMVPIDANTKRVTTTDNKIPSYALNKPAGSLRLFLPYTSLTKLETTPLPFIYKAYVSNQQAAPVEVGEGYSALRFETDRQKLRFVTVGIANIKFKKGDTGNVAWRIRTPNRTLYQSNPIPVSKTIENLYTDAFYIHQDDQITLELLQGETETLKDMKTVATWEMPAKAMKSAEQVELNTTSSDIRSVTVTYTAQ